MKNHYQTLGLEEGASQEAIQEAYDRLYKELDPEKNKNQDFFIEEFEKIQEAYKMLRNSSILSTEKGMQNSNTKSSTHFNSSESNTELIKNSKKLNFVKMIMREKKNIVSLILLTVVIKIIVHFFVFPTEILVLNTDKKIHIQCFKYPQATYDYNNELDAIREKNFKALEKRYKINGQIIITKDEEVFYYPKEKEKVSLAKHIEETFTQKLWLFPWVIFLLLLLFWIDNKSEKDKVNDIENKRNFSSYLSNKNFKFFLLILLIFYNFFLQKKIDKVNYNSTQSESNSFDSVTSASEEENNDDYDSSN